MAQVPLILDQGKETLALAIAIGEDNFSGGTRERVGVYLIKDAARLPSAQGFIVNDHGARFRKRLRVTFEEQNRTALLRQHQRKG
jgi:hypothetical protein